VLRLVPLLGLACLLAACGGGKGGGTTAAQQSGGCTTVQAPSAGARSHARPTTSLDPSKTYEVVLKTNCGSFTITLDPKQSPHATASFVALVQAKYLDKTIFHRIVPGFVIQGGDPTQSGEGGPGYTTVDKPPAGAAYTHGVVAMAKTAAQPAGTAGSQFFVVTAKDANLPPDYAIIGKVTSGLDVVDRIGKLGDQSEQPTQVVEIEQATVTTS
jgi:cyclophilin family peptidyl-prolyl cis-trans isomerase